jgi:hypothetical protein
MAKLKDLSKGKLVGGLLLAPVTGGLSLLPSYMENKSLDVQKSNMNAQKDQAAQQAEFEKNKYQAMVDANFSQVAKKKNMMSARSGQSLYGTGGTGLYG